MVMRRSIPKMSGHFEADPHVGNAELPQYLDFHASADYDVNMGRDFVVAERQVLNEEMLEVASVSPDSLQGKQTAPGNGT